MSDITSWFTKRQIWDGVFILEPPVPGENMLFELLMDGATIDMSVKGDVTAVEYEYQCPADKVVFLERSGIVIQDGGIAPALFGGIAALSTGLKIEHIAADTTTVKLDFTVDITIKKNSHFALFAGNDVPILDTVGANANDVVVIRWTIGRIGSPLLLVEGESFRVTVQDDLTNITEMLWMVQGHIFDTDVFNDA